MDGIISFLSQLLNFLNPVLWMNKLWEWIKDVFYMIGQLLIDAFVFFMSLINWTLPDIPTVSIAPIEPYLSAINWIVPFDFAVTVSGIIITSTIAYFTVGCLLRWAKVVS